MKAEMMALLPEMGGTSVFDTCADAKIDGREDARARKGGDALNARHSG
jgi:hypothetical protein